LSRWDPRRLQIVCSKLLFQINLSRDRVCSRIGFQRSREWKPLALSAALIFLQTLRFRKSIWYNQDGRKTGPTTAHHIISGKEDKMKEIDLSNEYYKFFQHRNCEFFPCHQTNDPDNFNCLFCYCPLYALGTSCGGNYKITENGFKDCSGCMFPHVRDNYAKVNARFQDIIDLTKEKSQE
jgi:Zn-finger protein